MEISLDQILTIFTAVTAGGGLGALISFRWAKVRAKATAQQEVERAEEMELSNTEALIKTYREAFDDLKKMREENERSLNSKLESYEREIQNLRDEVSRYRKEFESQGLVISRLTHTQNQLRLELETVKRQSISDCESCEFRDICQKYKVKESYYESLNDSHLLSDTESRGSDTKSN